MIALPAESTQPGNHDLLSTQNHLNQAVNLTSEPCTYASAALTREDNPSEGLDLGWLHRAIKQEVARLL
jgi:hypothetical protein